LQTRLRFQITDTVPPNYNPGSVGGPRDWSVVVGGPRDWSVVASGPRDWSVVVGGPRDWSVVVGGPRDWSVVAGGPRDWSAVVGGPRDWSVVVGGPRDWSVGVATSICTIVFVCMFAYNSVIREVIATKLSGQLQSTPQMVIGTKNWWLRPGVRKLSVSVSCGTIRQHATAGRTGHCRRTHRHMGGIGADGHTCIHTSKGGRNAAMGLPMRRLTGRAKSGSD